MDRTRLFVTYLFCGNAVSLGYAIATGGKWVVGNGWTVVVLGLLCFVFTLIEALRAIK